MRQCPTPRGESHPLIAHQIKACHCLERQREFYHKCHRCVFRGKPVGYSPEITVTIDATGPGAQARSWAPEGPVLVNAEG